MFRRNVKSTQHHILRIGPDVVVKIARVQKGQFLFAVDAPREVAIKFESSDDELLSESSRSLNR